MVLDWNLLSVGCNTDSNATEEMRERLRQLGLSEESLSKVHVHGRPAPHSAKKAKTDGPQKGLPLALPLVHVLNYLQDQPPWCCFASDPAQVCGRLTGST